MAGVSQMIRIGDNARFPLAGTNPAFSLWTAPAKIRTSYKWVIFILLLSGYLACAPWLMTQLGSFARIFVFTFALPAAFFWGLRGGVAVALATPVLGLVLHAVMGVPFSGGMIGPLFLLLVNIIVGRMCDLSLRLEKELVQKGQTEMELQQHQAHLEERVRARTAALTRTNQELQQEIAERKQVANALRESEEKYRLLVETANEAIFIAQDGAIKFPNPKVLETTGYSENEVLTMPFGDLIHPDDREMVVRRHRERLNGKRLPSDYSFRIITKAGAELWVQINAPRLPGKAGRRRSILSGTLRNNGSWKSGCANPRRSNPSAPWPAELPTNSTTSWGSSSAIPSWLSTRSLRGARRPDTCRRSVPLRCAPKTW